MRSNERRELPVVGKLNEYEYKIETVTSEIDRLNNIIEGKNNNIRELELKNHEGEQLARQFHHLNEQFKKITGENRDLHEEIRDGQEKLRVSTSQTQRLVTELNDYKEHVQANNIETEELKKKINKLYQENSFLNN